MTADKEKPQQKKSAPAKDSIVSVVKRNKDLEKRAFRAMGSTVMLTAALIVSLLGNIYQGTNKPEPRYFAQDSTTQTLTPIVPLTKPISSRAAVLQHVTDCIGSLNSIDFLNYRGDLMRASSCFTKNAWARYFQEFQATGTMELMERRQLVMSGVVTQPPVITGEGEIFGALYWDVEVPYRVRYVAQGFNQTTDFIAKVKVVRVPTTDNPKGISIAQFVAQRGASS